MRNTFVALFLIANIAMSSAAFIKKPKAMNFDVISKLREIDNHPFGKKIMDTIALQISSGAPLANVAKFLQELIASSASQLTSGTNKHNQFVSETNEYLKRENAVKTKADADAADASASIDILDREITQLASAIKNLESQVSILQSREVELKAARIRDREDFEMRQQQGPGVIEALELIVDKLSTIEATEDGRTVMAQLSKIGGSNPIAALLQIASTFSADSLNKVISQLDALRVSYVEALKNDKAEEAEAEAEYRHLLGEIQSTRTQVTSALAEAKSTKKAKEANREVQYAKRDAAIEASTNAAANILAKENEAADELAQWGKEKQSLEEELVLLKQVQTYIAEKLSQMKDYIGQRAEGF